MPVSWIMGSRMFAFPSLSCCFCCAVCAASAQDDPIQVKEEKAGEDSSAKGSSKGAKPKPKSQAAARKNKKGQKLCRGCGVYLPLESFPAGKSLCTKDNSAWRNLQSMAKQQGQETWLEDQHGDPKLFKELLANYHQVCGIEGKRNKRGAYSILTYKESQKKYSDVMFDNELEMMTADDYVSWSGERRNGGLTPSEAWAKFQELAKEADSIVDFQGPKTSRLRVAVPVRDIVRKRSGCEKAKTVEATSQSKKKATQEDIQKELERLSRAEQYLGADLNGHEVLSDLVATSAAAAASGQALNFSGDHVHQARVGDVKSLLPMDGEEKKPKDGLGAGKGSELSKHGSKSSIDGDASSEEDEEKKKKDSGSTSSGQRGGWWNRDEKIMSELRSHQKWVTENREQLRSVIKQLQSIVVDTAIEDCFGSCVSAALQEWCLHASLVCCDCWF